jgi:hypothetical protein
LGTTRGGARGTFLLLGPVRDGEDALFNETMRAATMEAMFRSRNFHLSIAVPALILLTWPLSAGAAQRQPRGRKFKPPPPVSRITVTVLRNDNDTPIRDAHVIFHPIENGKDRGGMELKTNDEGVAVMTIVPIGDTILLQVIAHGYQTYGGQYTINKADVAMHIRMKLPGQQYSVYDNHDSAANGDTSNKGSGQAQNGSGDSPQGSQDGKAQGSPKR